MEKSIPIGFDGFHGFDRRSFVRVTGAAAAAAILGTRTRGADPAGKFSAYPFALGIASGDPSPDGFVLWTRLAPQPLAPGGGMAGEAVEVFYQVAADEGMSNVVASGSVMATREWAHSVHVEVAGLEPQRWYWYQFKAGGEISPKGRARTLPAPSVMPDRLKFAFASCQNYEAGYYDAFLHMAIEDIDLVLHLGDYIYENGAHKDRLRQHNSDTLKSLDDYRARYALYKTDPMLQKAHEIAPWIVTWDDHEVANNYAGLWLGKNKPNEEFRLQRAAAYQAYYEHMPLRSASRPGGADMQLYRGIEFGKLASFHVLDTRQYRTPQPLGDGVRPPAEVLLSPEGTIMGSRQREWLFSRLSSSPAVWNVIPQQVMLARVDFKKGPEIGLNMDKWAGYEYERQQLLRYLQEHKVANPVVLTGDIHSNWAIELQNDFDTGGTQGVGVEFVGTSISSTGDGEAEPKSNDWMMSENPFVKFHNGERGYVTCTVSPGEWRTDYRTVAYVTRHGAPLQTRASFVVEAGRPLLQRA